MVNKSSHRPQANDNDELTGFGYKQSLKRNMGGFASFAVAFSMISVTNAIFFLFPIPFQTLGGRAIWLFIPAFLGVALIALTYAHLGARIPLTGYAYQWNSRMVNKSFGFATGWTAMLAFWAGTASIGTSLAVVFAPVIWPHPSSANIITFAGVVIAAAALLNIISIRLTALVNNMGVAFEIIGSLIISVVLYMGVSFWFKSHEGVNVLTSNIITEGQGSVLSMSSMGAALLLPIYTLLGWEGAADLAEETKDPRRVTPMAMLRANWMSVVVSLFMMVAFAVAIPHGVADMLAQTQNPMVYIVQEQLGKGVADVLQFVVFVAIFSCLLANLAVATRMTYSLARDNMLPASRILAYVSPKTGTPVPAVILVSLLAFGINFLSNGIANNVVSIVAVCYYGTYALTLGAVLYAHPRGKIPEGLKGGFSLGRWLIPVSILGMLFSVGVVANLLMADSGGIALKYFLGAELIGALWYMFVLRKRLSQGHAGPVTINPQID